jgi:hypothetical protein
MTKQHNNIHLLSGEQKQALGKFQKDVQTAVPHMVEMAQAAKRLHQSMIDAPFWRVVETPKPDDVEEPKMWEVGHAKVNYVEQIKHEGTQDK